VHPLTASGLVPKDAFLTVNAVSGYSGGGKALMEVYEADAPKAEPWGAYGFNLAHKHVPEMAK
jgi:N-acetyl-gamma-glutamyl-phosphate reductase